MGLVKVYPQTLSSESDHFVISLLCLIAVALKVSKKCQCPSKTVSIALRISSVREESGSNISGLYVDVPHLNHWHQGLKPNKMLKPRASNCWASYLATWEVLKIHFILAQLPRGKDRFLGLNWTLSIIILPTEARCV